MFAHFEGGRLSSTFQGKKCLLRKPKTYSVLWCLPSACVSLSSPTRQQTSCHCTIHCYDDWQLACIQSVPSCSPDPSYCWSRPNERWLLAHHDRWFYPSYACQPLLIAAPSCTNAGSTNGINGMGSSPRTHIFHKGVRKHRSDSRFLLPPEP